MARGARHPSLLAAGLLVAAGAGCASSSPTCDALCPVARPAFEGCLVEWGLAWGEGVGYADADDYDAWCATWLMEQRLLAETAADSVAAEQDLEDRCESRIETLQSGYCASYWGLWD